MFINGKAIFLSPVETYLDNNGEVESSPEVWETELPCSISTVSDNRTYDYGDGECRKASFRVLFEYYSIRRLDFAPTRIRLYRSGEYLGEFRIVRSEPIETQGRYLVIV